MTLYTHQQRALAHTEQHARCALWMGCGTGKTLVAIEAIRREYLPTLIIGPKRVIDHTWPGELARWWPECRWVSLATTPAKRQDRYALDADVWLVNFELIPKLIEETDWRWPMVVIDESSRVKSRASKLFKALRKVHPHWLRLIELTGTPAPNGLMDLWSQLYLIDGGQRLGKTITAYRERWFKPDFMGWNWTPLSNAQREIEDRCADVALSMHTEDYIDLPALTVLDVPVDLPPKARAAYRDMQAELIAEIDDDSITAASAAVAANKLIQITSGASYSEGGQVQLHTAKLDALAEVIDGGEPVLIVYQFRHELAAMRARWPELVELRDAPDAVERWNAGALPLMAIHPASAGHGLNLQGGGRVMVWTSPTYNLEHYEQTCARLYRNGQTRPVVIYRLLAADTIDQRVIDVLGRKAGVQNALLAALKKTPA